MDNNEPIQPSFGMKFEGDFLPIPEELAKVKDLKIHEVGFVSFDVFPSFQPKEEGWVDVIVTEQGEIYVEETQLDYEFSEKGVEKKEKSSKLRKVEDFTGEVRIGAYLPVDIKEEGEKTGKDYTITYKLVFFDGKFKKATVDSLDMKDSSTRVNLMDKINAQVIKQVKLLNNPFYRWLYTPYKMVIRILAAIVNYVWMLPLRLFNFVCKHITPF